MEYSSLRIVSGTGVSFWGAGHRENFRRESIKVTQSFDFLKVFVTFAICWTHLGLGWT